MGDPNPEAGSHPGEAKKPWEQQSPAVQRISPDVMSFINNVEPAYKAGLINPTGPFPIQKRAALIFDMNPANVGAEAEVPPVK